MEVPISKSTRVLIMQELFQKGIIINLENYATDYHISNRTAIRDLDELRAFYSEMRALTGESLDIVYDRDLRGYKLQRNL